MDLFGNTESYNINTIVEDSRQWVRKNNPIREGESREDYIERLFELANDEIERRILISGKKRPKYEDFQSLNKKINSQA